MCGWRRRRRGFVTGIRPVIGFVLTLLRRKGRPSGRPFSLRTVRLRDFRGQPLMPAGVQAAGSRSLVAEKHVAVRCRAIALCRGGSLGCAGSGGEQSDGSDQSGQNAFHGATPRGVWLAIRCDRWPKNSDSAPTQKWARWEDFFSLTEIMQTQRMLRYPAPLLACLWRERNARFTDPKR